MSEQRVGGRGGLRFTLFGFPVSIGISIVLLLAFLGLPLDDPLRIGLWVGIGIVSILLHELGHAFAVRAAGVAPEIRLAGLGGATTYRPSPKTETRGWSLTIGLAGPAVGIVLGLGAIAMGAPCCGVAVNASTSEFALSVFVFVSLVWSVLNLLPILPLDGGHAMASLLPGTPSQRETRAGIVGTFVGAAATATALTMEYTYAALLAGLMTWQNIQVWQSSRDTTTTTRRAEQGDLRGARDALSSGRGGPDTAAAVQHEAFAAGEYQIAAEVGEIALHRGFLHPAFAYNTACGWAQLGMVDRAVQSLQRALELGFEDRDRIRNDPDLAPLHDHPAWPEIIGEGMDE